MNAITRFNHARPLNEDQLFQMAPSIFATEAHHSRSDRFKPIATIEVIRAMAKEGFLPYRAAQSVARSEDRRAYTKHMVRFRHESLSNNLQVNDNILETVLVNGNDGSAAYTIDAGIFKVACLNGLIVKSNDYGSVRVRHTGNAIEKVIEGTYEVLKGAERAMSAPQDWGQLQLTERARQAFAVGAHVERFGDAETTITPEQLLIPRRPGDVGRDLWKTFNVIQENVITGGLRGARAERGHRRSTTREVRGIDSNVKLNKALWVMAQYLADRPDEVTVSA